MAHGKPWDRASFSLPSLLVYKSLKTRTVTLYPKQRFSSRVGRESIFGGSREVQFFSYTNIVRNVCLFLKKKLYGL